MSILLRQTGHALPMATSLSVQEVQNLACPQGTNATGDRFCTVHRATSQRSDMLSTAGLLSLLSLPVKFAALELLLTTRLTTLLTTLLPIENRCCHQIHLRRLLRQSEHDQCKLRDCDRLLAKTVDDCSGRSRNVLCKT